MNLQYPPVGSKWKEVDLRVSRTIEVIRYDVANRRVRINCLETQRLSWAKLERFNGKSGGYAPLSTHVRAQIRPNGSASRLPSRS